jgi:hypothetical protein
MKKIWVNYAIAYGMWVVFILLGVVYLIVSRSSLMGLLSTYYIQGHFQRGKEADLINQAYFLVFSLILLILTIVVEEYFKNGARKNRLPQRIARVMGIEMIFIFGASLAAAVLSGFSALVILVLVLELLLGLSLIWLGYKIPREKI